ncbi:GPI mannosyltransferase 2 [Golovinomyces cichoracearum]|uniref:GPI mannosyltransferase 2 n=1 Tax=Golovinomyces cichoracearum TaxID=62708 RepID=A0A420ID05_9PEZI|nr:GPI mannosyltransferase 2 [Golovinomyces cichoracearum]
MPQSFRHIQKLFLIYVCWKTILLIVAICSPGQGYDTSSSLNNPEYHQELPFAVRYVGQKLTRWDAIYFVKISNRGYVYEQEWAFGWGMTRLIALCTAGLERVLSCEGLESIGGILIAHIFHFFSVITLFYLTATIFTEEGLQFSFNSACLHIISPAGIFLSAPYAESSCAFFSFAGCLIFTKSFFVKGDLRRDFLVLISGVFFGVTTVFRSNGVLNGLLLLEEAIRTLWDLKKKFQIIALRHLLITSTAGLLVACGSLLPQYFAYNEYCRVDLALRREWCMKAFPSIYTFVQEHYWNVGLFRYWKSSNFPLFVLSAPMYILLFISGVKAINPARDKVSRSDEDKPNVKVKDVNIWIRRNLAITQLLLAFGTLSFAHVQIIVRISSSCQTWIWFVANSLLNQKKSLHKWSIRYMVTYCIVQAGLFSSFLPPA